MVFEVVRGYVQLASGLSELTRARATEVARGLLSLPQHGREHDDHHQDDHPERHVPILIVQTGQLRGANEKPELPTQLSRRFRLGWAGCPAAAQARSAMP